MKKFLCFFLLFIIFSGTLIRAGEKWLPPPDERWLLKLEPALEQAKKENKFVYVLHTGSDWCGWCVELEKKVLSQKLFSDLAQKHLILVYLDKPTKKVPMPQSQRDYNETTAKKLNFGNGYPEDKIIDADGKVVFTRSGYSDEKIYVDSIYKALKLPNAPKFPAKTQVVLKPHQKQKAKAVNASVEIIAWGTAPNKIDKPFSAVTPVAVAPGKRVYLQVRYQLPKKFRARLLPDSPAMSAQKKNLSSGGIYLFCMHLPLRRDSVKSIRFRILPASSQYAAAMVSVPCNIFTDLKQLSPEEKQKYDEIQDSQKELFKNSKFKIISWGYDAKKVNRPFSPAQPIRVKRGQSVYFKIRYKMPRKAVLWIDCKNSYSFSASGTEPASGEITRSISCRTPGKRDHLLVTFRPEKTETMDDLVKIPCNIIWE